MPKIVIHFPPEMLAKMDLIAEHDCRNRSELVREACRNVINEFQVRWGHISTKLPTNDARRKALWELLKADATREPIQESEAQTGSLETH